MLPGLKAWWLGAEGQQHVGLDSNDQSRTKVCQAEILKDTMRWHFNHFNKNTISRKYNELFFNHFYLQLHRMLVYGKCKDVHLDKI